MSAPLHRVCVAGASGRMGQMLVEAVLGSGDCELSGALDIASSPAIGLDAGAFAGRNTGARITADLAQGLAGSQVLIDFTRPEGTMEHLKACVARGQPGDRHHRASATPRRPRSPKPRSRSPS
jgi:4-hydroxy-tetrahydrodipicolinate reductase